MFSQLGIDHFFLLPNSDFHPTVSNLGAVSASPHLSRRPYTFCRVMSLKFTCEMNQASPVSPGRFLGLLILASSPALTTIMCHFQRPVAVIWSPLTGLSESLGALEFHGPRVAWPTHGSPQSKQLCRPKTPSLTLHFLFYVAGLLGAGWFASL